MISNELQGLNLYLIGMMGVGKTTIGKVLAEKFQYRFVDTDDVIVKAAGKSINEIFAEDGEAAFRSVESDVLAQISTFTQMVIATGGGIIMHRQNWSYMHYGLVIWLDAPVGLLMERLKEDTTRPLLRDPNPEEKVRSLLQQRQPMYAQADLRISIHAEETPHQIAENILSAIPSVLKNTENRASLN